MTETRTGTHRSAGVNYLDLLDLDSHPVRAILRCESPMPPGPTKVPATVYYTQAAHDLEVEKIWKRVWQLACHEDDIPDVGDYHVYDIAHLSFLVVRVTETEIKAYHNACLHRGRQLRDKDGKRASVIRCAFHGWAWNLDGSLREVPCEWDFPSLKAVEYHLPEVQVGRWGGFVFINPDETAPPLAEHLGNLADHFTLLPYERRYKQAHVAKILRCNWKVAQEAFMEAYHVVATHPTILESIGDANSKYDVFGNYSRAISPNMTPSPHLNGPLPPFENGRLFTRLRHALSGLVYEAGEDGLVHITGKDGQVSKFTDDGTWIEGPVTQADPHMCDWIGGRQLPGAQRMPVPVHGALPEGANLRAMAASGTRERLRPILGDDVEQISDAELLDSIYLSVFPNFHPWGSFNQIVYRFRPHGDNPDECIHECMFFAPSPNGEDRPPAAPIHWLGPDDDWVDAPELGMLAKVFNQDVLNLPRVQKGLKTMKRPEVIFANYGETKPRHFHKLYNEWLNRD